MKETEIVAIDLGNGITSYIAGNGNRGEFASLVAPYNGSAGLGGEFSKPHFKTQDGKRYLIGDDCREEGAVSRSTDSAFYSSEAIRVLFLRALSLAGVKNPLIITGLPTEFHRTHSAEFEKNLKRWALDEGYHPGHIKVIPQWAAAWFDDQLVDESGNLVPLDFVTKGKIGIIDIGHGTTDVGQFNNGKVSDVHHGESKGVSDIHRQLFTQLKTPEQLNERIGKRDARLPKDFALDKQTTEFTMDFWLRSGGIPWQGKMLDIGPISLPVRKDFADDLLTRVVNQVWGSTNFLNGIVMAGGGAVVLGRELIKQYIKCPILMGSNPGNSVVNGYFRFFKTQILPRAGKV